YSYAWTGPLGFDTTSQGFSIPNSIVNMTGKYYVNLTDQYGCAEYDSIDVVVYSLPIPVATYNPFVCAEKTLQLNSSDTRNSETRIASPPAYTYSWEGPLSYTSNEQNPTLNNATIAMSGSYQITMTDIFGCSASTSTEVIVHALPEAIASSNSPVCSAETLNLLSEDERTTQESPYTYTWTGPNDFTSEVQNPIFNSVSVSLTGIYSVTITDKFGCKATASTDVINHHPTATATNGSPYKESEDVNLLATGGTRYEWAGPNGFTSNLVNPTIPNAQGANSGTYTVTVTFEFCSVTATTAVNVGCSSPSLSYYLVYSDGTTPEVITPISQDLEIQKSSRLMTIMAIPSCSSPTLESLRLTISGVETATNRLYVDNEAPFRLHENTGSIGGIIFPPTLYTFISRAYDQDNAAGSLLIGPENIQFWIVNGIRDILIPNLTTSSACAGSSFNISSSSTGEFSVGNIYQAFLSDENGGFSDPILVGSSADPSSINCTIPNYIKGGSNYKIMVRSSAPVVSSLASSLSLSISPASNSLISPNNDLNNISTSRNAIFTIDASNKIMGTSNIIYKAQYNITLKPGFEASPGTVFSAEIGDACL
ncbi:MAG: hypothetical protein ACI97P_002132, partial [Arcticibacterium sp.]